MASPSTAQLPLVSIVTPCLNSAAFLRETIESVLAQDYPRIEYIVMDGGSTDGTIELLGGYHGRLRYFSEPDRGASDAINKGFERSGGSILAWLNADDTLLAGTVRQAVEELQKDESNVLVYGDGWWVDQAGRKLALYPTKDFDPDLLRRECFLCQPAVFFRRAAAEAAGFLDDSLHSAFDYDLWIRLSRSGAFGRLRREWATSRMHSENKSLGNREEALRERIAVLKRHFGYAPFDLVYSYCGYRMDRRDQFFDPLRPSIAKFLVSLPVGVAINARRPFAYVKDWLTPITWGGLLRSVQRMIGRGPSASSPLQK